MFDVGFNELIIIAIVALIVLGPERLPKAARFAGLWVRRARAQWYSVKAELERELAAEDLRRGLDKPLAELRPELENLQQDMQGQMKSLEQDLAKPTEPTNSSTPPPAP